MRDHLNVFFESFRNILTGRVGDELGNTTLRALINIGNHMQVRLE